MNLTAPSHAVFTSSMLSCCSSHHRVGLPFASPFTSSFVLVIPLGHLSVSSSVSFFTLSCCCSSVVQGHHGLKGELNAFCNGGRDRWRCDQLHMSDLDSEDDSCL